MCENIRKFYVPTVKSSVVGLSVAGEKLTFDCPYTNKHLENYNGEYCDVLHPHRAFWGGEDLCLMCICSQSVWVDGFRVHDKTCIFNDTEREREKQELNVEVNDKVSPESSKISRENNNNYNNNKE